MMFCGHTITVCLFYILQYTLLCTHIEDENEMSANQFKQYNLQKVLDVNMHGITSVQAQYHLEACLVCLDYHQHQTGVLLKIEDRKSEIIQLNWSRTVTDKIRRSWDDLQDATEHGAIAIAVLLLVERTNYSIVARTVKGNGFDYWLSDDTSFEDNELIPTGSARLEVSGILTQTKNNTILSRINRKEKQVSSSDNSNFPAIILVVEFSHPEAHLVEKI